jgi:H+-translocating NAD(P) transhydrogenase subunit alpha
VVVCTAAVPGRPAPKIITAAMVANLKPGSVIVDLAAETGGNCELTKANENNEINGVLIAGPINLASMGAMHASEMYARNVFNFLSLMIHKEGAFKLDWEDELIAKTCLTHEGISKV